MTKLEREYNEKYDHIPKDMIGRMDYLISTFKSFRPLKGLMNKIQECQNDVIVIVPSRALINECNGLKNLDRN